MIVQFTRLQPDEAFWRPQDIPQILSCLFNWTLSEIQVTGSIGALRVCVSLMTNFKIQKKDLFQFVAQFFDCPSDIWCLNEYFIILIFVCV